MSGPDLPLVQLAWEHAMGVLFDKSSQFPKVLRHTLTNRIELTSLDVLEHLIEARFATGSVRRVALQRADRRLAQLRALVRFAHARHALDHRGLEQVSVALDESGRQIGGWLKHEASA